MANRGDWYEVELKQAHLEWGTHRYTDSRGIVYGEVYLAIPRNTAEQFKIFNSNGTNGIDCWGQNIFACYSSDGMYEGVLRAQGNSYAGDVYAKQFSEDKNLKGIGGWYQSVGATVGGRVRVQWISPDTIEITYLG